MLCTEILPSPFKNNPEQHPPSNNENDLQLGLKALSHSDAKLPTPHSSIVHCYTEATTSKPSSPPQPPPPPPPSSSSMSSSSSMFQFSVVDNLIGSESGDCMSYHAGQEPNAEPQEAQINKCRRHNSTMTSRQYPPPIPLLAQTGNSMGRMPLLFEREYGSDGRLIITAERVGHHEYLETHRENGRLIMTLVKVEVSTACCDEEEREELEEFAAEGDGEDGGFHSEEELAQEDSILWQESSLENESELCGAPIGNLGRTGWAPLGPMTTVM